MTLTVNDIINKDFTITRFREGYDQTEVDQFLDEVIIEFQRLEEISRSASISSSSSDGASSSSDSLSKDLQEAKRLNADLKAENANLKTLLQNKDAEIEKLKSDLISARSAQTSSSGSDIAASLSVSSGEKQDAVGLITLAQKLHDQHVQEGTKEKDRIIFEAKVKASSIVKEAETKANSIMGELSVNKANIEKEIKQLKNYETHYRHILKETINEFLNKVDGSLNA